MAYVAIVNTTCANAMLLPGHALIVSSIRLVTSWPRTFCSAP